MLNFRTLDEQPSKISSAEYGALFLTHSLDTNQALPPPTTQNTYTVLPEATRQLAT